MNPPEPKLIKVLVADDAPVTRLMLVHVLQRDPQIRVIGSVADGQAALHFVLRQRPDLVLMDINMPRMDGFAATRLIMESSPVPIVVCSAFSDVRDTAVAFRALEAGAVACIEKPFAAEGEGFEAKVAHLLLTVKLMSEVRVVRRRAQGAAGRSPAALEAGRTSADPAGVRVIGIGASTGGPPVLQAILAALPPELPVPVLVVQHIAAGFLPGMIEWLSQSSRLRIQLATYGTEPLPGHVYLAPDDHHLGIGAAGRIILSRGQPEHHVRPAVSFLFRSLATHYGADAVGVLLTGMGRDGAEALKQMKDAGAVTIAQDQDSSLVHGMPGAAIALGGATQVLPAERIAEALLALAPPKPT